MTTPDTSLAALRATDDAPLRRQVAAALREHGPMTTHEIASHFPERSLNAVRPRVNELLRMNCVERRGKRTNPSGNAAYVHHLTELGEAYSRGEADPEPDPPVAEAKRRVVDAARDHCAGRTDRETLAGVVAWHDRLARRMDPEGER